MFRKINLNLGPIDMTRIKGEPTEKYGPADIKLTHHKILDMSYFIGLHAGKVKFPIMPDVVWYTEIEGTGMVPPHIDPMDTVALNYYIQTGECTTTFYEPLDSAEYATTQQEFDVHDHARTVKAVMNLSDLQAIGKFTAGTGDAYFMRPNVLHSVSAPTETRKFLSYRWTGAAYEQVLASTLVL